MKRTGLRVLVFILCLALMPFSTGIHMSELYAFEGVDERIPEMPVINISGSPIQNGGTISVEFDWLGDPFASIALNLLHSENTSSIMIYITPDHMDQEGHIHLIKDISSYLVSGTYYLSQVYVNMLDGRYIMGSGYENQIVVENSSIDLTAPILDTNSISLQKIGNELVIDFGCVEEESGLSGIFFSFNGGYLEIGANTDFGDSISRTETGYQIRTNIEWLAPDTYRLDYASIVDRAGNGASYSDEELPLSLSRLTSRTCGFLK
jgi:hypothetical protein